MISLDKYLMKSYSYHNYNCWDFVREVWLELTGTDLGAQTPNQKSVSTYTQQALKVANTLTELDKPQDPCLVLLRRARLEPHIGVYVKGRVLHLTKKGAYYVGLDQLTLGYFNINFYK